MAIKTKEELLKAINEILGDNADDSVLSILEDIEDTFKEIETATDENWKQKYEDNDKQWREKYKNRFFESKNNDAKDDKDNKEDKDDKQSNNVISYNDLFKEA